MEFSYRLTGTGWAEARIADAHGWTQLTASYLSDPLGELLTALVRLQEGESSVEVSWFEEPGEYNWLFVRRGDEVELRVLEFPDWSPHRTEGTVVFATTCSLPEMTRAFTSEIRSVLEEWREERYRTQWVEHPFPTDLLTLVESRIDA